MRFIFLLVFLITASLKAEDPSFSHTATYPTSNGTYIVGDWKYTYVVELPGTKSQGVWGRLYYQNKELTGPRNGVISTPVGTFIFFGGLKIQGFGEHGWFNTLRDYTNTPSPIFEKDGKIKTAFPDPIKMLSTRELLDLNKET